jgi:endoglucanase
MTGKPRQGRAGRRLRLLVGLSLALITAAGVPSAPAVADTLTSTGAHTTAGARAVVAAMQPSWNLGNTLDAIPTETAWGNPLTTKAMFDTVRAAGFRSVRIPVTWSNAQATTAPYTIDPAYMARVKQVVDWAIEDGLYVDLNVHHDSWQWIKNITTADHDAVLARFDSTWQQIAAAFRDEPRKLLFESVNEPQFTDDATEAQKTRAMDELNTSFHTVVRRSGGRNATRVLLLPDQNTSPTPEKMGELYATITRLHDPNLGATVHYYSFWPFSVNNSGFTTYNQQTQQDLIDDFTAVHDVFVAKGIPVYLGEYGTLSYPDYTKPDQIERGEAFKYFEQLGYEARINGITTALWDAGSFLDRNTLQWRDPELTALIRASWHTRSGTASTDQVFLPKSAPVAPHTVTLNLNGLRFRGLWQEDGTRLRRGVDYAVSGDQLTLTPALLTRLGGDRAYGENATFEARFSRGVPWTFHVISNDLPVQSDATGTTGSLTIPTQFKGDVLATMESRYADGSPAGPYNWTPYQEFNTTFTPDYPNGAIRLTSDYLKSLTDGATVTLTFDFWSGASVTYRVTRSGDTVTGTVS